uniref:Uncharacterized protein n=1 Tax=Oryza barthii TaxID=65489 RepID=A0A0D3HSD3_9ORYZ
MVAPRGLMSDCCHSVDRRSRCQSQQWHGISQCITQWMRTSSAAHRRKELTLVFLISKVGLKAQVLVFHLLQHVLISKVGLKAQVLVFRLLQHVLKELVLEFLLCEVGLKALIFVFLLHKHDLKALILVFLLHEQSFKALDFAAPSVAHLQCLLCHLC